MNEHPFYELMRRDDRYSLEAYQFVRDALSFAQETLGMGKAPTSEPTESHLTGQQLCEAIRVYAIDQFGLMARTVLNSWGVTATSCFGDIVYNLIDVDMMKKSDSDRREDFDDVYDFETVFDREFKISMPGD